jgi:hypothetical protein
MKQIETGLGEMIQNGEHKYICKICDYKCSIKFSYDRHLLTSKHLKLSQPIINETNEPPKHEKIGENEKHQSNHVCECGQVCCSRTTLWRHKKKCNAKLNTLNTLNTSNIQHIEPQMLLEVLKQNQEFQMFMMDQQKQMMDIASKVFNTNNTFNSTNCNNTNNTNNINNSFNLQVFLNEKCKDAMNMSEFIDTIKMQLSDLENFAHLGYADGVSKIFVQGINALDVHLRPIHCSDSKRETLYIKDNNEWVKETDDKPLIKSAIKRVAFKNIKQINEWIKENPECKDPRTKKYDKYNKIVMNSMSGGTIEEQQDNIEKIVKNVTKAVAIEKYALK